MDTGRPLHEIAWLHDLTRRERDGFEADASARDYAARERIFAPNREPSSVYLLESGLARIYRISTGGDETTFGYVRPGEIFGEVSVTGPRPRESFAEAVEPSRVWRIAAEPFRAAMAAHSVISLEVTRQIGTRLKRIENRVESLVFHETPCRIACVLCELAEDTGLALTDHPVELALTQSELATLVGATRQTVNASLGALEARGLIERQRGRIRLPDPDALREATRQHSFC